MKREQRWLAGALLCASVLFAGCKSQGPEEANAEESPATVVHGVGSQPSRVTLTAEAVKKIDVQTAQVRELMVNGASRAVIPYGAVLYDADGDTWTYVNTEPRVYVRYHISVDSIERGVAVLAEGPPSGTAVVTVGASELFGAESEFEEE